MSKAGARNIRTRFQLSWILLIAFVSVLGSVVLFLTLRGIFTRELGQDYGEAFVIMRNLDELLAPIIGFSILFYIVVVSTLASVVTLFLSYRIAGPIFQIEQMAERLGRGDLTRGASPRHGNELGDLSAAAFTLQEKLATQLAPLKRNVEAMDAAWTELDMASPEEYRDTAAQTLAVIKAQLGSIKESLRE